MQAQAPKRSRPTEMVNANGAWRHGGCVYCVAVAVTIVRLFRCVFDATRYQDARMVRYRNYNTDRKGSLGLTRSWSSQLAVRNSNSIVTVVTVVSCDGEQVFGTGTPPPNLGIFGRY